MQHLEHFPRAHRGLPWTSWQAEVMSQHLEGCRGDKGTRCPSCQEHSLKPPPRTLLVTPHQRQHHAGGEVFICTFWLGEKHPPLPERNAGLRETPSHLAGTPNRPQGRSVRALWASEAAKTSLSCINREIKCLLSQ